MKYFAVAFLIFLLCAVPGFGQTEVQSYLEKAKQLYNQRKFDEATVELSKAIAIAPNNADLYIKRAQSYTFAKDFDAAEKDAFKAVSLNPDDESTHLSAAHVLLNTRKCQAGLVILDQFITRFPQADRVYSFRTILKQCIGDVFGAFEDSAKAVELKPDFLIYQQGLAINLSRIGDEKKGFELINGLIKKYETALAKAENTNDKTSSQFSLSRLYNSRSELYKKQGDTVAMFADLDKMVEYFPKENSYRIRATAFKQQRRYGEAIQDFTEVIRLKPKEAYGYLDRGDVFSIMQKYSEAIADWEQAAKLDERVKEQTQERISFAKQKMQENPNQSKP